MRTPPRWSNNTLRLLKKVNVWCGIIGGHVISPFFINGNVNGESFLQLLQQQIIPAIREIFPVELFERVYFQQDGAPPHYSVVVRNYLDQVFPQRWIGRGVWWDDAIEWPPRFPDLTTLDFFLWGYVKDNAYRPDKT